MRVWTLSCLLILLAACGTERIVEKPVVVEVVKTEWREVPPDLLLECIKPEIPDGITWGELAVKLGEAIAEIETCNGQLRAIGSLGQ